MTRPILRTQICDLLGIEYPIILAGMGAAGGMLAGVSSAELVAAVSEAGGLGVLGAVGLTPEQIHEQCAKVRDLTKKPFGVDTLLPGNTAAAPAGADAFESLDRPYKDWTARIIRDYGLSEPEVAPVQGSGIGWGARERQEAQLRAIMEEKVAVFASGLGSPGPYVKAMHDAGIVVMSLVGNVKNARRVNAAGADIIVAQGYEAGGHTGRIGTFALTPQVVDAVAPTPVVLAGGVGDGRGVAAALALGAQGVWVGTAFIATTEANTNPEHKQRMIDATDEDARVTRFFSGKTMRNLNSPIVQDWEASGLAALPMGLQGLVSGRVQAALRASGRYDLVSAPTGQITGMVKEVRPAGVVLDEMVREAVEILGELTRHRVTIAFSS